MFLQLFLLTQVYIIGGLSEDTDATENRAVNSIDVFDLATETVTSNVMTLKFVIYKEEYLNKFSRTARLSASSALIGSYLYVCGGINDEVPQSSCETFDLNTNKPVEGKNAMANMRSAV
jgi:hypothetical protein